MAIALRGSASANGSAGSIAVPKPSGVVDNDYLIAYGVVGAGGTVTTAPSGWTTAVTPETSGIRTFYVYVKRASGEGSSWTWSLSGFVDATMAVVAYSGVDTTTANDVAPTQAAAAASGSTVIPSGTTVTSGAWAIAVGLQGGGTAGALWTVPSGYAKDGEFVPSTASHAVVAAHNPVPVGATGTITLSTSDTGNTKKGVAIFLRPAGGGGGDTTPPTMASASVNGATLTATASETLDAGFVPAASAFIVKVNSVVRSITNVAVSGTTVTLTLASPVTSGQTVTLTYSP